MNLGVYLTRSARYWPDEPAVVCADRRWTFRRLEEEADRLASALLGRGLGPGDAVASLAWNRGELVVVEFALYKAGLMRAPINARLGRAEIAHILAYAPVRALIFDAAHAGDALAAIAASGSDCLPVAFDEPPAPSAGSTAPPGSAPSPGATPEGAVLGYGALLAEGAGPGPSASRCPRTTRRCSTSRRARPARSRRRPRPWGTGSPTCASSS
ncbi:AMP-binding protein [Actinomadura yumaensis]|uniref:AMP-binding protein n=1 Tax=Actinomadura yumaensis TaxID=111807 RepID=UPI00361376FF